jgi:hypothetical protein
MAKKSWSPPTIIVSEELRDTSKFTIGFEFTTPTSGKEYGPNS